MFSDILDSAEFANDYMEGISLVYQNDGQNGRIHNRTACIDESGSYGFDFTTEGTSRYYIVCSVIVTKSENSLLNKEVDKLRAQYFGGGELKSSSLGNQYSKIGAILSELSKYEFSLVVLIVDKLKIKNDSGLALYKGSFIKYLHQLLYEKLVTFYPELTIIEDEHGRTEFQNGFKKYVYDRMPEKDLFNDYDFNFVDSKENNIVQVADLIAGSIQKNLENNNCPNPLRIFQKKVVGRLIRFPDDDCRYYKINQEIDNVFDESVYSAACKSINDYISNHETDKDELVRLRIATIQHLLFKIRNMGDFFTNSQQIVDSLNQISYEEITRSFLYRRIIAPLRDAGVLISSSPKGYKVPTSVKDISTYINQSTNIIGPMMNRINICRKLILAVTDGKLDVLEGKTLISYKAYINALEPLSLERDKSE